MYKLDEPQKWVTDWSVFNNEMNGLALNFQVSAGITCAIGFTKNGYIVVSPGVDTNIGAQGSLSYTHEGIDKDKYFRKEL